MKISEILEKKSITYKLLFDHIYLSTIGLFFFFYVVSYLVSLSGLDYQGYFYETLIGEKINEFEKSNLPFTDHIRAFIFISNLFIFVGPLLLLRTLKNQPIKKSFPDRDHRKKMWQVLVIISVMIILFAFCIYITPFSENLWGYFFYYNHYIYFLSTSFIFACIFCYQFCIYCYIKVLFYK